VTVTYIDAGVLIAANRSRDAVGVSAIEVLTDADRIFVSSFWLRLEVEPKARYHKQAAELAFYGTFFDAVEQSAMPTSRLATDAFELAARHGLAALDALHVAAAISLGAEEFVTAERHGKPMFRVPGIQVVSIRPLRTR
jgi:predicted nucleic acid-binding protein